MLPLLPPTVGIPPASPFPDLSGLGVCRWRWSPFQDQGSAAGFTKERKHGVHSQDTAHFTCTPRQLS